MFRTAQGVHGSRARARGDDFGRIFVCCSAFVKSLNLQEEQSSVQWA
jgi:hypothetical protein